MIVDTLDGGGPPFEDAVWVKTPWWKGAQWAWDDFWQEPPGWSDWLIALLVILGLAFVAGGR